MSKTNLSNLYILPDNYIYISHLDEDLRFWRIPTYPETIQDTMQSSFSQNTALGRTAPVYTFSNAGPRTVQVTLNLHRDIMDDVNAGNTSGYSTESQSVGEDYVDNLINALRSIALPKYNLGNKNIEPPLVACKFGKELFIKGIVSGGVTVTSEMPILSNDRYARVSISFVVSEVDPYDATSVYKNGGFRGMTNTLRKGMNMGD